MIHEIQPGSTAPTLKSLPPEDEALIIALATHQGAQSDALFCKKWLGIHASAWSKIKSRTYEAKDWAKMLDKLRPALDLLDNAAMLKSLRGDTGKIIPLYHLKKAIDAVKKAQGLDRQRLVMILGGTGAGKTFITRGISQAFAGRAVCAEATESWRTTYLGATQALCRAAGITTTGRAGQAEETLIQALQGEGVVIIDEGHHFGPKSINLIKAILNKTPRVVVLLAIKPLLARMRSGAWIESEQLLNRTSEVIDITAIMPKDFSLFMAARLPGFELLGDSVKEWTRKTISTANEFGLWNTVEVIAARAREAAQEAGETLSLEHLELALEERQNLRRSL